MRRWMHGFALELRSKVGGKLGLKIWCSGWQKVEIDYFLDELLILGGIVLVMND